MYINTVYIFISQLYAVALTVALVLGLEGDQSVEYGNRHCHGMAAIINRFINDGQLAFLFCIRSLNASVKNFSEYFVRI